MCRRPTPPPLLTTTLLTVRTVARSRRWAQAKTAEAAEARAQDNTAPAVDTLPGPAPTAEAAAPLPPAKRKGRRKRKTPPSVRAKISRAMKGRKKSAETRAKVSQSLRGHPVSAKTRAKLSRAFKGRKRSAKTRAKISKTLKGHPVSPETRAKISHKLGQTAARGKNHPGYQHGAYATPEHPVETIEDVIADLGAKQARLSALLDQHLEAGGELTPALLTLFALHSRNASNLARQLIYQKSHANTSADELARAVNQALDELASENGWEV